MSIRHQRRARGIIRNRRVSALMYLSAALSGVFGCLSPAGADKWWAGLTLMAVGIIAGALAELSASILEAADCGS